MHLMKSLVKIRALEALGAGLDDNLLLQACKCHWGKRMCWTYQKTDISMRQIKMSAVKSAYSTQWDHYSNNDIMTGKMNRLITCRQPPPCPDPSSPGEGADGLASFLRACQPSRSSRAPAAQLSSAGEKKRL